VVLAERGVDSALQRDDDMWGGGGAEKFLKPVIPEADATAAAIRDLAASAGAIGKDSESRCGFAATRPG
jgi:hypothetical protein